MLDDETLMRRCGHHSIRLARLSEELERKSIDLGTGAARISIRRVPKLTCGGDTNGSAMRPG